MKPITTILTNATIYTLDARTPQATALAIQSGRVIATGQAQVIQAEFGDRAHIENLHGKVVIPGLTDAHIHLQHYALGLAKVDCETTSRQECLARVAERAKTTPPGTWILGHGWNQNNWPEGFGDAKLLDQAAPNHPVYLTAKSLHAAWANTRAINLAQLTDETPDPVGGRLERDRQGCLTGILFESAMNLVGSAIPAPTPGEVEQAITAAIPILHSLGLTGVHDFDRRDCFMALQNLRRHDRLTLRVVKSIPLEDLPYAAGLGLSTGFGDDFLRIGSIKAFADGALGPQTAAMLKPYENDEQNRGILLMDAEELFEHGRQAVEAGLSLAVHAIGDRANHEVLEAIQQLRRYEEKVRPAGSVALRHRIEHVQVIHADDAHRLAELGIIASMQPIHATSDMLMADRFWGKRAALSYALQTQLKHGAHLAFGSDAPVESPNPFWGLHAAVTRQRLDGSPGASGWYPEQRLTILEAIGGFTTGAAFAAGMEDRLGRLSPGYLADLLVLDTDPFECPPSQIADIQPRATMVNGEWVWQKAG
jgi:predicted amidohydrolase YtcJ